jgi:sortase A
VKHDNATENGARERALAAGQGAGLAAFYDRRAAAALAYCSKVCAPGTIADAVEASFARVFERAAADGATDDDSLDASLRSAVRSESAARSSTATAGVPARRLLERLADPTRGGACELMPALLAARADGQLSEGDRERMTAHLRRCADCRAVEQRFAEAEQAFDALAGDDAPALGRSLLAEMLTDAPLNERRRFARERLKSDSPDWLEEIDWEDELTEPRVIQVPADALEPAEAEPEPEPEPVVLPRHDPAVVDIPTQDFPMVPPGRRLLSDRARRRVAIAMLVVAVVLLGEAGITLAWKEPFTAFMAARAQDRLTSQLHKLNAQKLTPAEQRRVASISGVDARAKARMAALAEHERFAVAPGDALGTIAIPKIGIDYVFVQGTEGPDLRKGPGRYLETHLPGQGAAVGIAGHRTSYEAPFRNIDELKAGDAITLKMPYGVFTYVVDSHRIVPSGYRGAFASVKGEGLVLSACHPLFSASHRILVYAHLASSSPLGAAADTAPAPPGIDARALARRRAAARLKAMGTRSLSPGMTGSDVKEVQRLLGLPATGTFGPQTAAAVREFQQSHRLPAVGNVGDQTKRALARRPHPPSRPPTPPAVPQQQAPGSTGATTTQSGQTGTGGTGTAAPSGTTGH